MQGQESCSLGPQEEQQGGEGSHLVATEQLRRWWKLFIEWHAWLQWVLSVLYIIHLFNQY